jgi:hypothetical protein
MSKLKFNGDYVEEVRASHTPGEWTTYVEASGKRWIRSPRFFICELGSAPELEPIETYDAHSERLDADARLIAAAPEMLEALKAVHKCYFLHSEYPKICEQVDAAIAKAEGRDK